MCGAALAIMLTLIPGWEGEAGAAEVVLPAPPGLPATRMASRIFYLNRFGARISPGADDAVRDRSSLASTARDLPAWIVDDATWATVKACIEDQFAPFAVSIVDVPPPASDPYVEAVIGGAPEDLIATAREGMVGVAPMFADCRPLERGMVFVFARRIEEVSAPGRVARMVCETAAHELGHAIGLDHALDPRDPMSYLPFDEDRTFQANAVSCGELEPRACGRASPPCRASQDAVAILTERLGPRSLEIPRVTIVDPEPAELVAPRFRVDVELARRVDRVELWIDGELAMTDDDAPFELAPPERVADGPHVLDVVASNRFGETKVTVDVEVSARIAPTTTGGCTASRGGVPVLPWMIAALGGLRSRRRARCRGTMRKLCSLSRRLCMLGIVTRYGALAGLAAALGACTVPDVDYAGKPCPCPPGGDYTCNPSQKCERIECDAKLRVSDVMIDWATPNSLHVGWTPDTDHQSQFVGYEVSVGEGTPADADPMRASHHYTAETSAELGRFQLIHTNSPEDFVRGTIAWDLEPATSYWAQVRVFDKTGCAYTSAAVGGRTQDMARSSVAIFDDKLPAGVKAKCDKSTMDAVIDPEPSRAAAGNASLVFTPPVPCALQLTELMSLDIDSMTASDVALTAYLELSIQAAVGNDWTSIWLEQAGSFSYSPYTVTGGAPYRRVQIPFSVLVPKGGAPVIVPASRLMAFKVAGDWTAHAPLRLDEIYIRW